MTTMINVQLDEGGPITQLDEAQLVKTTGLVDNDHERTTWVEYRLLGADPTSRAIHRSAHVTLKKHPAMTATQGDLQ